MRSFKLDMNVNEAEKLLSDLYIDSVSNVTAIEMGELSRVFSFTLNNKDFVVHFKNNRESFDKATFIYEAYSSALLPIPKVIKIGNVDNMYYAISEKASGKPISLLEDDPNIDNILNNLAGHFTYMSQISMESNRVFGMISSYNNLEQNSWKETLSNFFDENQDGFHQNWTRLYSESFLEKSLFEEGFEVMIELANFSPATPHLVHGDFHLGNMLSDGQQVTGIVDWEMAMFGDFMFDLAGLHFWSPQLEFPQRVRNLWAKTGKDIPYFEERLRCHLLFKGIDGLRFFAKKDDQPSYNYMRERVITLLK
ncbi:aminoglycoside phosphotransferase family protein [Lederbergia lenta]|uniref:Hygromycin-B 4-O-kinase n=1 Tax=Lederbergia lenta TaxID=1467 RepID=A0A2X4WEV5_LEDLE|nr:aminoglycoside phosphotransferase family protein [Lederbergia lenta]MCM3113023.1 aminoglycoside phosphotransferase family protein [Lederbergia lenta]MEC2322749.1 aminoglycoside phosphotransferase family protein [Lederbergia lenta]SQI61721.1 Hygromycin-B 4-O-kinase [Lederbergia lenta]